MQDPRVFQEIEALGEQEESVPEKEKPEKRKGGSWVPVFQAVLCALALLALVLLKATDSEKYGQVTEWYRSEQEREIELPGWDREKQPAADSFPESSTAPAEIEEQRGALQKI